MNAVATATPAIPLAITKRRPSFRATMIVQNETYPYAMLALIVVTSTIQPTAVRPTSGTRHETAIMARIALRGLPSRLSLPNGFQRSPSRDIA